MAKQDTGLLVLWMTNRSKLWRFMEAELLPGWGLEVVATWLWLKVTSSGNPVGSLVCLFSLLSHAALMVPLKESGSPWLLCSTL